MTDPKEVELKLELPPASLAKLGKIPMIRALKEPPKREAEVSVYFDTDTHKLRKHGVLLRVRHSGDRYVQAIKVAGNGRLLERDEWESEIAGEMPELDRARGTALEPLLSNKLRRRLKPLFETRVRRTTYPLVNGAQAVVLTVDRGKIDTGERSTPLCEIELELERGDEAGCSRLRASSPRCCRRSSR